ncbi:MAG: PorV/PorQ family protein, partial [Saprospiraceae bacterium]
MAQKYSNEFLAIGAGARAQGMGNSSVASSSDAYSPYWNPAGMAGVESNMQLAFMHAEWFAGVGNYDYLSLVYPIYSEKKDKRRAFGISAIRFGVDDIPNTLSLYADDGTVDYNNITSFSSADYAFLLSYAQDYWMGDNRKLFIGGNAKVIYRNIGSFAKAVGFGFDLGAQFHLKNVSFGLTAKDLTNTFNAWNFSFTEEEKETLAITNNEIPINSLEVTRPWFILGSAYHKRFGKFGMLTELDFRLT